MERTHLVGSHRERVNIALFRGVTVQEVELPRVEQFWSHVSDNALQVGLRRTVWFDDRGIGYDTGDPEVP